MEITVRNPSHCPCGSKWVAQNKDGSNLTCLDNHAWEYKKKQWRQVEQRSAFLSKITQHSRKGADG